MQPPVQLDKADKAWKIIQHIYSLFTRIDRVIDVNGEKLRRIKFDRAIQIPKLLDKDAEPYTLYHSVNSNKLVYKDDVGGVNELY